MTEQAAVLAAIKAAMDPDRKAWQHDILVSAVVELLARKGPLPQRQLSEELEASWIGRQTSAALLTQALETARDEGLLVEEIGRKGARRWSVAEAVSAEAEVDRMWAKRLIEDMQLEVTARLRDEFPDDEQTIRRAPKLTKAVIDEMVKATRGVFQAVQASASPRDLHEARLNLRAVVPDLRTTISPVEVADVVAEFVIAAADPDQDFGNEVLRTIVSGQILHGMVCRADVSIAPPSAHLVLDTSQLLLLAHHEPKVVGLFKDFLTTANAHGCTVVVTDHVIDEWDRHWQMADEHEARMRERYGENATEMYKIQNLYLLQNYAWSVEASERSLTFEQWASSRRNLKPIIRDYGVEVVQVDEADVDLEFAAEFADAIERLMTAADRPQIRSQRLRRTDGLSAALVEKYRERESDVLVPTAWFVARDKYSNLAYEELRPGDFPLVVDMANWVILYSAFSPQAGLDSRPQLVDQLSASIVLEAFMSVASTYTPEEMLELGDLLGDGESLDEDDVRSVVKQTFLHPETLAGARTENLARARIQRQSARVLRAREHDAREKADRDSKMNLAEDKIRDLGSQLEAARSSRQAGSARTTKEREGWTVGGVVGVALLVATLQGWLSVGGAIVAWLAFAYLLVAIVDYVTTEGATRTKALVGLMATVIVTAVQFVLPEVADVDWGRITGS
jgi:hypothetical protein